MAIILDLETVAIDGAEALTEPVSAPANYKDPAKIAAYIADAEKAQREKAALYPWTSRAVAIGAILDDGTEWIALCRDEAEEAAALTHLNRAIRFDSRFDSVRPIVGFNTLAFDLPVLMARARLLGVPMPEFNLNRYRDANPDLLQLLTFRGTIPARSLKWYARRFGLPVDDTISGADIAGLVAAGDWDAVRAHCLSDIRLTKALAERLGVVRGGKVAA